MPRHRGIRQCQDLHASHENIKGVLQRTVLHLVVEVQQWLEFKCTSTPINDSVDALEHAIDAAEPVV